MLACYIIGDETWAIYVIKNTDSSTQPFTPIHNFEIAYLYCMVPVVKIHKSKLDCQSNVIPSSKMPMSIIKPTKKLASYMIYDET
jgi:hypothetical protein